MQGRFGTSTYVFDILLWVIFRSSPSPTRLKSKPAPSADLVQDNMAAAVATAALFHLDSHRRRDTSSDLKQSRKIMYNLTTIGLHSTTPGGTMLLDSWIVILSGRRMDSLEIRSTRTTAI